VHLVGFIMKCVVQLSISNRLSSGWYHF